MLLNKALIIAADAHDGQYYGKAPYITHPLAVWKQGIFIFSKLFGEEEQAIALLHDTIEDTFVTASYLRHRDIPEYVIEGVELLSKPANVYYEDYIDNLLLSDHLGAIMTKYADNRVNAAGDKTGMAPSRIKKLTERYLFSIDKLEKYFDDKNIDYR